MDQFTTAYFECALWVSIDDNGTPLDREYSVRDISAATRERMENDCARFQAENPDVADNPTHAGHDFWLTRNHHGAGFWDGDWPKEQGERLTTAAHAYGEFDLYVGDDGRIYA